MYAARPKLLAWLARAYTNDWEDLPEKEEPLGIFSIDFVSTLDSLDSKVSLDILRVQRRGGGLDILFFKGGHDQRKRRKRRNGDLPYTWVKRRFNTREEVGEFSVHKGLRESSGPHLSIAEALIFPYLIVQHHI